MRILTLCLMLVLLSACSQSPLQKLKSDTRYDDMNPAFWAKEQAQHTPLWQEATNYCEKHTEKPNCAPVMQVLVISNSSITAPAIGDSGQSIHLPDFSTHG